MTVAPPTTAPLESVTVPVSVAANSCPRPATDRLRTTMQTASHEKRFRTTPELSPVESLRLPHVNFVITLLLKPTSSTPTRKCPANANALCYIARDGS